MLGIAATERPLGWAASDLATSPLRRRARCRDLVYRDPVQSRMSRISAWGNDAWPPMLCWVPAAATVRPCERAKASASRTWPSVRGRTTP